jgi:membrane-bound metal-dependent hydrolase YbcI (DUF457 family)
MPMPLGHAAIGLTVYDLYSGNDTRVKQLKLILFLSILANLPDIDTLLGLVLQGDGNALHRGVTHSIFFSVFAGYCFSKIWNLRPKVTRLSFKLCTILIFSHVVSDFLFTRYPVCFFWPFESIALKEFSGWNDFLNILIFKSIDDLTVVFTCFSIILANRIIRFYFTTHRI